MIVQFVQITPVFSFPSDKTEEPAFRRIFAYYCNKEDKKKIPLREERDRIVQFP